MHIFGRAAFAPEGLHEGSLARSAWNRSDDEPSRRVRYDLVAPDAFPTATLSYVSVISRRIFAVHTQRPNVMSLAVDKLF